MLGADSNGGIKLKISAELECIASYAALGYLLIRRFNKQFELTVYGRKVYQFALKRIEEESELLQDLGRDEPFSGRYIIGCSGTFSWLLYPELLSLQSEYSKLSIEV